MSVISLNDYRPAERHDGVPWNRARIEGAATKTGPWSTIETKTLSPVDSDPTDPAVRSFTTTLAGAQTWLRIVWLDASNNEDLTQPVPRVPTAFASAGDVEVRLGRELTEEEEAIAEQVVDAVTGLIADSVGRDSDWAASLDPVPPTLSQLCIEKAVAKIANPVGALSTDERLGDYSYATRYAEQGIVGGLTLTRTERALVRRAIFGSNLVSTRTPPIADDLWPIQVDPFFFTGS